MRAECIPTCCGICFFKNDQDVCWLEHDYMKMKMIVRDQSKNDFHLTAKIGPLGGGGEREVYRVLPPKLYSGARMRGEVAARNSSNFLKTLYDKSIFNVCDWN